MDALNLSGKDICGLLRDFSADSESPYAVRMVCRGGSMSPFIPDESVVTMHPFSQNQPLKVGDVVALFSPQAEKLFLHRVIAGKGARYLIKGDNNPAGEGWFHQRDIIAIVSQVERPSGMRHRPHRWMDHFIAIASRRNFFYFPRLIRVIKSIIEAVPLSAPALFQSPNASIGK